MPATAARRAFKTKPSPNKVRTRAAAVRENSFDPETGTFTAIVATGTPVGRKDYFEGDYKEVLQVTRAAVRLDRLASGRAPLLDSHRGFSARDQIGVVTGARIEGGELVADLQLSDREDVAPIAADIAAGIIRSVSVGYLVHASAKSEGTSNRVITRTDWEPIEISLVPIPADQNAQIRTHEEFSMPNERTAADEHADDELLIREEDRGGRGAAALTADEETELYRSVQSMGIERTFVRGLIAAGASADQVRAAVMREAVAVSERQPRQSPHNMLNDQFGERRGNPELTAAIGGALYARLAGKPAEGPAVDWRGRSLLDMGAALLEARGVTVSWRNRDQLASQILGRDIGGSHTTSDFPNLLTGSGNRVLMDAYKAAGSPLRLLARERDAVDFRPLTSIKLSEAPALVKVPENGEITYGSRGEAKETFRVETFARIFSISRQAIVNDDLGAFGQTLNDYGRAAAEREASELVALFTANSGNGIDLDDGDPIYTTGRGNKVSATAIDETNLGIARAAMRVMKGADGTTPISVTPKFLVVGPAKETQADKMVAAITPASASDANPFSGKLTVLVEPRFAGNAWRLFADPAEIATIAVAYLNGQQGPILEQRDGWTVLGTEFRAVFDFGCGIEDWRGTLLNPGA